MESLWGGVFLVLTDCSMGHLSRRDEVAAEGVNRYSGPVSWVRKTMCHRKGTLTLKFHLSGILRKRETMVGLTFTTGDGDKERGATEGPKYCIHRGFPC